MSELIPAVVFLTLPIAIPVLGGLAVAKWRGITVELTLLTIFLAAIVALSFGFTFTGLWGLAGKQFSAMVVITFVGLIQLAAFSLPWLLARD